MDKMSSIMKIAGSLLCITCAICVLLITKHLIILLDSTTDTVGVLNKDTLPAAGRALDSLCSGNFNLNIGLDETITIEKQNKKYKIEIEKSK